jgi:hypothetical protein
MSDQQPTVPETDTTTDEIGGLARELGRAYRQMVEHYQREWKLAPVDADAKARGVDEPSPAWDRTLALERPADEVHWFDLQRLAEHDPEAVTIAWNRIKAAAREDLASGHRTAEALEWRGNPWDRARFLALRDAFRADWQPRGGIETALVDTLAQNFTAYLYWTARLTIQAQSEGQVEDYKLRQDGYWQPPRIGVSEAIAESARMAEQAHRLFLRTLRALQDLRRLPGVYVTSAGQVNVASRQVNLAPGLPDTRTEDTG